MGNAATPVQLRLALYFMPAPRVLIIQEDWLLTKLYREQLEAGGFAVESVNSGDEAVQFLIERHPDAVLIDSLTPGWEADEVVRQIRARPATRQIPIFALPTSRAPVARALQLAGATVLGRTTNLPAEVTDAVQVALGHARTTTQDRGYPLPVSPQWDRLSIDEAPTALNRMRLSVQSAMRAPATRLPLRELLQEVHTFTERLALFSQRPIFHFSAALEALVYDLPRQPALANPSILRTIGQAIDFCSTVLHAGRGRELRECRTLRTLIVDDEDGASRLIMAALSLVDLTSLACDSPAGAFAALKTQSFDLIFLDIGLPGMNGFELCHRIRSLPMYEKIPIIFVTGMGTFQNRVQSNLSGGNDFIGKPFSIAELGLKAQLWLLKAQLDPS